MDYVIGVDLGATQLRAALVDTQGTIARHARTSTRASEGPDAVIGRIVDLIAQMRERVPGPLLGVGVGAPGPLDSEAGVVVTAPNMPGWENVPLRAKLEVHTDLRVSIGNDANLAALAEWRFGSGKGLHNLIYLTVSTGIGSGIVAEGRLLLGRKGMAAEVGHMAIAADGPRCSCGNTGCWEALASGTALARIALEQLQSSDRPSKLREIAAGGTLSATHIGAAAEQGDELARQLLVQEGFYLGVGIVNLLHLFSPEIVIMGGGVTNIGDLIFGPMRAVITERAIPGYHDVPVVRTQLGDEVGVLGAAALAFHQRVGSPSDATA